jgi:RNA polymerase sigma factor (TIGR02999 family)
MGEPTDQAEDADLAELIPRAYDELRRLARARVARLAPGGTLSPTDLVNEVLLRLLKQEDHTYRGTDHLLCVAAQAMHNVLLDRARRRLAVKRGGGQAKRVELDDELPIAAPVENMIAFNDALEKLRNDSGDLVDLVILRVYAGLSLSEIAQHRGVSTRTLERKWNYAKAVLHREMSTELSLG